MSERTLLILRGLPGSGKSTLARVLADRESGGLGPEAIICEADAYFMEDGVYRYNPENIKEAHIACYAKARVLMEAGAPLVIVSNTNTQAWEFADYTLMAKQQGYLVHTVVVENRHGGETSHGVPDKTVESMKERFEVELGPEAQP
jgi:predicted kinase